ncbi:MAG: hypothetical protein H6564_06585 [Lewinellaceae bacterium]|nr:hypothetical protein [Lewinellaceae bacterium]
MKLPALLAIGLLVFPCLLRSQWQPLESPQGVEPHGLVIAGSRIFAATASGLYFSDDEGESWSNSFSGELARGDVGFVKAAGQTLICQIQPVQSSESLIFISSDGGDSWSALPLPAGTVYGSLEFNGTAIIYRTQFPVPVYLSYDLGENWIQINGGLWPFSPVQIHSAGGVFFGQGAQGGLWRSDSLAANWENLELPVDPFDLLQVYNENGLLLAGFGGAVHYSQDEGQTWNTSASFSDFFGASEGFWGSGDSLFTIHNGGLYLSIDQGINWAPASLQNAGFIDFLPLEGRFLLAGPKGIYRSPDLSQTLIPSYSGIEGLTIDDFALGGNKLFFFEDGSMHAATITAGSIQADSTVRNNIILDEMASADGYFFFIERMFLSFNIRHRINRIAPDGQITTVMDADNTSWLADDHLKYTDDKLFYFNFSSGAVRQYSTDYGASWNNVSELCPIPCFDYERHEDAVFAIALEGVIRRRDGESGWTPVNNGLDFEVFPLGNGVLDTRLVSQPGALYLLLGRQDSEFFEFYVSHDAGDSWQPTATGLPDVIVPYLNSPQGVKNFVAVGGYHIMALRDVGIAISADQGLSWTVYNDGLPTDEVNQIEVQDGRVIAATRSHGFWELRPDAILLLQAGGHVFFDENMNAQLDAGEIPLQNVKILMENGEGLAFSGLDGQYQLSFTDDGAFGPHLENPYLNAVPSSRQTTDSGPLDFAFQLVEAGPDISVSLHTHQVHRPGFPIRFYLQYQNLANAVNTAVLRLDYFSGLTYEGASQPPSQLDGNSITFETGPLSPLASGTIAVDFTLDALTPLGIEAQSTLTATLPEGDAGPDNNVAALKDIVAGSYDPNDILVDRESLSPEEVLDKQVLRYRIRFQNTGTYPAARVVVRNTVAEELDLSSITGMTSSHEFEARLEGRRELAFVFDNIHLPDSSSNELGSHGFIEYDIRVQGHLSTGDSIRNHAAIYFDFNPPIFTDTACTVVNEISGTRWRSMDQQTLLTAPNPVVAGTPVRLVAPGQSGELFLFDPSGRLLRHQGHFVCDTGYLSTRGLAPGSYWAVLLSEQGKMWAKLLVLAP